jgi:hypothetical protein
MIMEFGASVFLTDLGIAVLVNKKRLAGYLLGGVLVVVLLLKLLMGNVVSWPLEYDETVSISSDRKARLCTSNVEDKCEVAESVNLSETNYCYEDGARPAAYVNASEIRALPSVEDVNRSTGVVTCDRPQFR